MDSKSAIALLKKFQLRTTNVRVKLVQLLAVSSTALSYGMIEKRIGIKYNRVTLYRVLKKFEEHQLIYSVPDFKGTAKYIFDSFSYETGSNSRERIHFNCKKCNAIFCFNQLTNPAINLPDEYVVISVKIILVGICPECRNLTTV